MRPIVRAALAAAVVLAVARFAERGAASSDGANRQEAAPGASGSAPSVPCPPGSLPDDGACIPVPIAAPTGGPELRVERNQHRDRHGRLQTYEHIPRRPDRPADYRRYRLPVPIAASGNPVSSGYDLHLPDADQRRAAHLDEVGHGGIDIAAPRGTAVRVAALEHQGEPAEVLFTGDLFGTTVVTLHRVREGAGWREYVVLYGHLERVAATLRRGATLTADSIIGFVGDSGSPGVVHLHLEIRRVRDGTRVRELAPRELVHQARTVAVDPRNLLELLP